MTPSFKLSFILFLLSLSFNPSSQCKCPSRPPASPPKQVTPFPSPTLSDEVINGINYGKPININNIVFLQADVAASGSYTNSQSHQCPPNFRLPSKEEIETVIAALGDNHSSFVSSSGINLTPNKAYLTTNKLHPDNTNGEDPAAWIYHVFVLKDGKLELSTSNAYFNKGNIIGKCITTEKLARIVKPEKGVILNRSSEFTLSTKNVKGVLWKLNNVLYDSEIMIKRFKAPGCYLIEVFYINLSDDIEYDCVEVTVLNPYIFNKEPLFYLNKMKINKTPHPASVARLIFFSTANGPVAPKIAGGYYIAYQNNKDKNIYILEYNAQHEEIANQSLNIIGNPYDIVATEWGFVIFYTIYRDGPRAYINGYFDDFTERFSITLVDNPNVPKQGKTQICFYQNNGNPYFGMAAQYKPSNGRLLYANGKIQLTYAMYNNFEAGGVTDDGHTGDHYIIFDVNGDKPQIAAAWSSSHSCIQSSLYDGRYFVTAALGDAYPQNVKVHVINADKVGTYIDPVLGYHSTISNTGTTIFPHIIPGNGGGNSCGRMGGLFYNGKTYAVVYSIKPCKVKLGETDLNEFGVMTFEIENAAVVNLQKHVVHGIEGRNIVNLRAGQYGKNLLCVFSINPNDVGMGGQPWQGVPLNYRNYMVLIDFEGNTLTEVMEADETVYSMNDEMRVLHDGTLIWTAADGQTPLKVIHVDI